MIFFVSARIGNRDFARQVMDKIQEAGYEIVMDWTTDSELVKPYLPHQPEITVRAERDIHAVLECDVFVLLTETGKSNSGMYVELGAAIASAAQHGKPDIYVLGEYNEERFFFFHPLVKRMGSIDELLSIKDF